MRVKPVSLVIWMAILTTSLYIVANNLPPGLGSFRFFWGPMALLLILLVKPATYTKTPMKFLLLYGFISLILLQYTLWNNMNDWNRLSLLEEFYALVVFTAIFCYYWIRHDFKGLAIVGKLSFLFILITIISTHIALCFDSYIVRKSASPVNFTSFQSEIFRLTGAAGYGYAQALVCLIPILIYHIKFRKKMIFSRKILFVILILIIFLHIRAQVFANLIVAFVITILSFTGAKNAKKSFILIALLIILIILIPTSFYADMLVTISSHFDSDSNIYFKLNDFAKFIQQPEFEASTAAGLRAARYTLLLEAFLSQPLLGDSSYNSPFYIESGFHIYWMYKLTLLGIFGFLFFVFVLYQIYKRIRSLFDNSFAFYYFLSVAAFILLGLIKNISGREPFLMLIVVIPGLYFVPLLDKKKIINRKKNSKLTESPKQLKRMDYEKK